MTDNIINTFQQRRQLALDVAEMSNAESEFLLQAAATAIVDAYPKSMIQAEVLKNLDTPDSQLRGGLGQIVAQLPTESIAPALRSIAADRSQPSQSRLTAVNLLSQFTDESVPQALINDLNNGNEVALQSLREAVEEGKKNRLVLLDYVQQMRQADDHIASMVLDMLDRIPEEYRVELLRLIALDDREYVASDALRRLELLASIPERDDALRALHTLRFMLPPSLTDTAVDALRRLRFSGRVYTPPEPVNCRALMTFPGLIGGQSIWFVRMTTSSAASGASDDGLADDRAVLIVNVNTHSGAISASGNDHRGEYEIPTQRPIGMVIPEETTDQDAPQYLESPFDYARWLLLETLPMHWEREGRLTPALRLYGDLIWEYARPVPPAEVQAHLQDEMLKFPASLDELITKFKESDAYHRWLTYNARVLTLGRMDHLPDNADGQRALARSILAQLESQPVGEEIAAAMNHGLHSQAVWLQLAGYPDSASLARAFASVSPQPPLSKNPLLVEILQAGFRSHKNIDSH